MEKLIIIFVIYELKKFFIIWKIINGFISMFLFLLVNKIIFLQHLIRVGTNVDHCIVFQLTFR